VRASLLALPRPSVLYVSRGPFRGFANRLRSCFDAVATVNEASNDVAGPIDFGFFKDVETLERARPSWDRIARFICPEDLGIDDRPGGVHPAELGVPRLTTYSPSFLAGKAEAINAAVEADQIACTYTVGAGLHWLALHGGFRGIYCIGNEDDEDGFVLDTYWHPIWCLQLTARAVRKKLGTVVRFWRPGE
jgi:hypothetical protein